MPGRLTTRASAAGPKAAPPSNQTYSGGGPPTPRQQQALVRPCVYQGLGDFHAVAQEGTAFGAKQDLLLCDASKAARLAPEPAKLSLTMRTNRNDVFRSFLHLDSGETKDGHKQLA